MNSRPDFSFIANYSTQFAERCCRIFFDKIPVIDGKQVLNLTSAKQVNLFIVKALFEAWQKEATRFKSPVFNYEAPEVKGALMQLMNLVSKNINMRRDSFEPMLREAVEDTLVYAISPAHYFEKFFHRFDKNIHVEKTMEAYKKYYSHHAKLFNRFLSELRADGLDHISPMKALKMITALADTHPVLIDTPDELLKELSQILPIRKENLTTNQFDEASLHVYLGMKAAEGPGGNVSVFDLVEQSNGHHVSESKEYDYEDFGGEVKSPAPAPAPVEPPKPPVQVEKPATVPTPPVAPAPVPVQAERLEEVAPQSPPVLISSEEEEEEEEVVPLPPGVSPVVTVYDQIKKDSAATEQTPVEPPVVTQREPEPTQEIKVPGPLVKPDEDDEEEKPGPIINIVGVKKDKPSPLKGNIPLNLKFRFQNELFNGNSEVFAEAIEAIDQCATYPEAMAVIRDQYIRKFGWNINGEATIEFLHLVDNKF